MFKHLSAGLLAAGLIATANAGDATPSGPSSATSVAEPPTIRLPSITSRWRRKGEVEAPDISLDDIERCMGDDLSMQHQLRAFRSRHQALQAERSDLEQRSQALNTSLAAVQAEQQSFDAEAGRWKSANEALTQQSEAIERQRAGGLKKASDVAAFNALVKRHNAEVTRLRDWRPKLVGQQDKLRARVAIHNTNNTAYNDQVTAFNQRNEAYQAEAAVFMQASENVVSQCAGPRTLRK